MPSHVRVVLVEDDDADAELIERQLSKSGLHFHLVHVRTEDEYLRALSEGRPDIIIADHKLPQFSGHAALRLALNLTIPPPVIMVTGSLDEEAAVEYMKAGAADYILKDRLTRLGPAVLAVLNRANRRQAERAAMIELQAELNEARKRIAELEMDRDKHD